MADRTMTPDEMEQCLGGKCLANLAALKRDGSPQVAPNLTVHSRRRLPAACTTETGHPLPRRNLVCQAFMSAPSASC